MARSLNKVLLIGNLTNDPELRYTPQGSAACHFGLATNRSWKVGEEKHEETTYHKLVAWNKLGELCSKLLTKGKKVYIEGRIVTKGWTDPSGMKHTSNEIHLDEMIILDSVNQMTIDEASMTE